MSNEFFEVDLLLQFPYQNLSNPTLIDVGAHVGLFSKPFAKKRWQVLAFEPEPSNNAEINKRLKSYSNVNIINKAVSKDTSKSVEFYISKEHWGIHSLKPFHETHEPITVESVHLDKTLAELDINEVSLLKVDTEGADFWVLQSCDFNRVKPEIVMCEFGDRRSLEHFNYSHHDIVTYMKDFGYTAFVSEWKSIGQGYATKKQTVSSNRFVGCYPYPLDHKPAWGNLIFVRNESAEIFQRYLNYHLQGLGNETKPELCPICSHKLVAEIGNFFGRKTDKFLPTYFCLNCESVFNQSNYEADDEQLQKIKKWYVSVKDRDIKLAENLIKSLEKTIPRTKNVLQVDCGIGIALSVAKKYFTKAVGYDTNKYAVQYGKEQLGLDIRNNDWQDDNDDYDLILCISVLHKQAKPKLLFKQLANKARQSKSALFVSVPIFDSSKWDYLLEENLLKKGSPFFDNDVVKMHLTEKGLLAMAEKNNVKRVTPIKSSWKGYLFEF